MALDRRDVAVLLYDLNSALELVLDNGQSAFESFVKVGLFQIGFIHTRKVLEATHNGNQTVCRQRCVLANIAQNLDELLNALSVAAGEPVLALQELSYLLERTGNGVVVAVNRAQRRINLVSKSGNEQAE